MVEWFIFAMICFWIAHVLKKKDKNVRVYNAELELKKSKLKLKKEKLLHDIRKVNANIQFTADKSKQNQILQDYEEMLNER
jgi:hypothetical protein